MTLACSGCGIINRIRAKNELNEGARSYKANKFVDAQHHFEKALELDPDQKNAPVFIARSLQAQFKPGVDAPENQEKARKAIASYQQVLANDPTNDDAYNNVAFLYGALNDDDQQRQWIAKRAALESVSKEKRADAYTVLASKEWDCSYKITELKENQQNVNKDGKVLIQFKKPKDQKDFDTAQQCTARGMELIEKALAMNPDSESAWSYKTNLLRESAKLAEMDGKADQKAEFNKKADEAQKRTTELSEINNRKKKEEEARKAEQKTS
jgi:tetratricopeptide (TPR) repeat protein